jgi:hypothetical protein
MLMVFPYLFRDAFKMLETFAILPRTFFINSVHSQKSAKNVNNSDNIIQIKHYFIVSYFEMHFFSFLFYFKMFNNYYHTDVYFNKFTNNH